MSSSSTPRLALRIAPNGSLRYQIALMVHRSVHSCRLPSYLANSRRTRDLRSAELSNGLFGAVCWIEIGVHSFMIWNWLHSVRHRSRALGANLSDLLPLGEMVL